MSTHRHLTNPIANLRRAVMQPHTRRADRPQPSASELIATAYRTTRGVRQENYRRAIRNEMK